MESGPDPSDRRHSPARTGDDRQAGSWTRDGVVSRHASRQRRPVRGHANRAIRRARESAERLALARTGMGDDAGSVGLVRRHGGARRARPNHRGGRPQPARAALAGAGHSGGADWLCAEPRGGRLHRHPHAPRAGLRREDCGQSGPPTTGRGSMRRGPTRPAISASRGASCCARWSGSGSSWT